MIDDFSPGTSQLPTDDSDVQIRTFKYDRSDSQSIAVSITRAVASVSGVDPLTLQPRLYDVVDPDALKRLLTSGGADSDVRITFTFGACEVTVRQTGQITVRNSTKPSN